MEIIEGTKLLTFDGIMFGIGIYFLFFYCYGVNIRRHEKLIKDFYWGLREKYPRSYVKQNKVIRFLRKRFRMDTKGTIHWVNCIVHYLHIVMVLLPILLLILCFFLSFDQAAVIYLMIWGGAFFVGQVINDIFSFIQLCRCEKMKKRDPKYSKIVFRDWP